MGPAHADVGVPAGDPPGRLTHGVETPVGAVDVPLLSGEFGMGSRHEGARLPSLDNRGLTIVPASTAPGYTCTCPLAAGRRGAALAIRHSFSLARWSGCCSSRVRSG